MLAILRAVASVRMCATAIAARILYECFFRRQKSATSSAVRTLPLPETAQFARSLFEKSVEASIASQTTSAPSP